MVTKMEEHSQKVTTKLHVLYVGVKQSCIIITMIILSNPNARYDIHRLFQVISLAYNRS